jgi:hypothetical protein
MRERERTMICVYCNTEHAAWKSWEKERLGGSTPPKACFQMDKPDMREDSTDNHTPLSLLFSFLFFIFIFCTLILRTHKKGWVFLAQPPCHFIGSSIPWLVLISLSISQHTSVGFQGMATWFYSEWLQQ